MVASFVSDTSFMISWTEKHGYMDLWLSLVSWFVHPIAEQDLTIS